MQTEKKTFTQAEAEVIRFDKTDIITTSTYTADVGAGEGEDYGDGPSLDDLI